MNATAPPRVTPLIGSLGAEIDGIDLAADPGAAAMSVIETAFIAHHLLVFRDQSLSPVALARFASGFGPLEVYPFVRPLGAHPNVIPIIKEPSTRANFGGGWHTDTSYLPAPPKATVLYAVEVPEEGGDTLFANGHAAWEAFSEGMRAFLAPLTGIYTAALVHGRDGAYRDADHPMDYGGRTDDAEREVEHALIRRHEETGRRAVYASLAHCVRIKGWTRAESLPVLELLHRQMTAPEFTTRLRWRRGTLAIWDNRCVWHYALNDYHGKRREMHRVIVGSG